MFNMTQVQTAAYQLLDGLHEDDEITMTSVQVIFTRKGEPPWVKFKFSVGAVPYIVTIRGGTFFLEKVTMPRTTPTAYTWASFSLWVEEEIIK